MKRRRSLSGFAMIAASLFACTSASAQVSVTATAGNTGPLSYSTLRAAFNAVNSGVHQGTITIDVTASTTEGTTPATLNSSGAGSASYTSVLIRPTASFVTVAGNPPAGYGVVQLNGADNVTIDGDNPNTAGVNRDLTIVNTASASAVGGSAIRIATSAAVTSADNITIRNCIVTGNVTGGNAVGATDPASSANVSFGIYAGGNGGATATGAPAAITSATANPAPSGTTINNLLVRNNAVSACGRGIVFNGAATSVSTGVTMTFNVVGDQGAPSPATPPYTSPSTTVYTKGIWLAGTNSAIVGSNVVRDVISYVWANGAIAGIELAAPIGTVVAISGNTITNIVENDAASTGSPAKGVLIGAASGTCTLRSNVITNVQSLGIESGTVGMDVGGTPASGSIDANRITTIYSRSTATWGATGVNVLGGTGLAVRNNFIADIRMDATTGSAFSIAEGVHGLKISGGTAHKIYHNSVHLYGLLFGGTGSSILTSAFTVAGTGQTGLDVRNNAFANTLEGGGFDVAHVAVYLPAGGTSAMNLTLDNNGYYHGADATREGVGQAGTTAGTGFFATLAALSGYSATLGSAANDGASFATTHAVPFASSTDLHVPPGTPSHLESSGAIVGVGTDIDGETRPGPPGSVNGFGFAPDIGADEFDGNADEDAPVTTYTPFGPKTASLNTVRTLLFTLTDYTGAPTTGAARPRLYLRKNAGAWASTPCVLNSGTATNGSWECQLLHSSVGGVVPGDVISYFLLEQDTLVPPNVGSNPAGAVATDVNTLTSPPPTLNSYLVVTAFPASLNVGAGETVTSLTNPGGLFESLNAGVLTSNVAVQLTSDLAGETGAVALNQLSMESGSWHLTISPAGSARTIAGSSATASGLIRLSGADHVTIDGSLFGGEDRSLTITNGTPGAAVVWIASAGATDGAGDDIVKNCVLSGVPGVTVIAGVIAGGSTFGGAAEAPNSGNAIRNNRIFRAQNGVYVSGNPSALDASWSIVGNTVGSDVPADKVSYRGILVGNASSFDISDNTIAGVVSAPSVGATMSGIQVSNAIAGGTIAGNRVSDIRQTNSAGGGSNGISLGASTTSSNLTVANNFIRDVASYGRSGVTAADNGYGIVVLSGGGYTLVHNTIDLATDQSSPAGTTADVNIASGVTAGAVDLRDNVLANNQTVGTRYAVYAAGSASVFSTIDYNDYYAPYVGYLGSPRTTLALWKAATSQDAASLAVEPLFHSDVDLHLKGTSPLLGAGTPIGSVTNDVDHDPRPSSGPPDIGADEVVQAVSGLIPPGTFYNAAASASGADFLLGPVTITSELTLNGVLSTNGPLTIDCGATVGLSGAPAYLDGPLSKIYCAAGSMRFELGALGGFSPLTVNVVTGSFPATVSASAVPYVLPGMFPSGKALKRFWRLQSPAVTADLTFAYDPAIDLPPTATEANLKVFRKESGVLTDLGGVIDTTLHTATLTSAPLDGAVSEWTLAEYVAAPPTAAVSGSVTVCPGSSADLSVTLTGTAPWAITWSDGLAESAIQTTPHVRTVTGIFSSQTYSLTALSDANGPGSFSGSATITVGALSAPSAGSDSPVCDGATLHLTASSPVSGATYSWTGPGGFTSLTQNPAISPATSAAAGTYSVTVTADGCTSSPATVVVAISPDTAPPTVTPSAPITVMQTACCGDAGGASGETSAALHDFLYGGTASDDCDPSPAKLPFLVAGGLEDDTTCFGPGATAVTFRFRDSSGKTGSANANVTVRLFGDLNLDGVVDPSDMVILRGYFNFAISPGTPPFSAPAEAADVNHDAAVDPTDMVVLRAFLNFVITCLAP